MKLNKQQEYACKSITSQSQLCIKLFNINIKIKKRLHNGYMQTLSFKHILEQNKQESHHNNYLFTKLKQNITNKSTSDSLATVTNQLDFDLDDVLTQCELEFQILKLEKANQVATKYIETGEPIQNIMKEVERSISGEIEQIIKTKYLKLTDSKQNKHLESTLHNTESHSIKKQQNKNSAVKSSLTPKIVQFTLGNREASSAKSKPQGNHKQQEVSQFFINGRGVGSKNIREKLMGQKKFK